MAQAKNPYGDGFASVRIADVIEKVLEEKKDKYAKDNFNNN